MKTYLWLMLAFISQNSTPKEHALYLSVTEIHVDSKSASISIKVFSDDLRDALKNHEPANFQPADLDTFFQKNKGIANKYFAKYLEIQFNNQPVDLILIDHEVAGDAHFIHFSGETAEPIRQIDLKPRFLMELFPTQLNVVKVTNDKNSYHLKFDQLASSQSVSFQP